MNCPNCGAPLKLFRERDYYFCEHCQSYHFPNQDSSGFRVLGKNPQGINCPRCREILNLVTFEDFFQGYQCSNCQGLLFNRDTYRKAVEFTRSRTIAPPDPFSSFDPAELDRVTYCPVCETQMETFQYNGPGNIVIDTCHPCDLIWLDYGEIQKVINAPGRDRGVPRVLPEKDVPPNQSNEKNPGLEQALHHFLHRLFNSD